MEKNWLFFYQCLQLLKPINNNGAEGLLSVSIEEMKELREFTYRIWCQGPPRTKIITFDACSVWPWSFIVLKAGHFKEYTTKDLVGKICTRQSHFFSPFPSCVTDCFASPSPARQSVAVHSLNGRPRRPCSSNFRLHVDCARKKPSPAVIQGHHRFCYF